MEGGNWSYVGEGGGCGRGGANSKAEVHTKCFLKWDFGSFSTVQ